MWFDRRLQRILAGAHVGSAATQDSAADEAIRMLTVYGADQFHRDGWMFQVMSWIAANKLNPGGIFLPPQMTLAHKGFDGMELKVDSTTGVVSSVTIFEDKATDNPRETIYNDVWPEFSEVEAGKHENVIVAKMVSLLRLQAGVDPDAAIESIMWKRVRHYRISITIGNGHSGSSGRNRLFKDYEKVVQGAIARRRGETFVVQDLRAWMADLATKAIAAIYAMRTPLV